MIKRLQENLFNLINKRSNAQTDAERININKEIQEVQSKLKALGV